MVLENGFYEDILLVMYLVIIREYVNTNIMKLFFFLSVIEIIKLILIVKVIAI